MFIKLLENRGYHTCCWKCCFRHIAKWSSEKRSILCVASVTTLLLLYTARPQSQTKYWDGLARCRRSVWYGILLVIPTRLQFFYAFNYTHNQSKQLTATATVRSCVYHFGYFLNSPHSIRPVQCNVRLVIKGSMEVLLDKRGNEIKKKEGDGNKDLIDALSRVATSNAIYNVPSRSDS